ncbi:MAG: hypothetical protein NTW82_11570 [Bacteroidia bacterium]|nr:hypothetical protein [Bacteroidia bacterium]
MNRKFVILVILLIVNTFPYMSYSQEIGNDTVVLSAWEPTTSLYFELGGKGWYSLNVDFRKKVTTACSIGIQYSEGFWPSIMAYRFFGNKYRIETGGGISGMFALDGIIGAGIHGVFGYRYQKKDGLIFRAGFMPFLIIPFVGENKPKLLPWAGISFGYSF